MRHIIPVTICTVAVGVLGYGAYTAHRQVIHDLTVQNAQATALQAKQAVQAKIAAEKQESQTQATINKLEASCKQGLTAYNALSVSARVHMVKPDCSL